ncbi:MAG: hypothetical protein WAR22_05425 [Desulfomonilia bacterium]|jgi:hypothetical protein
MKKIALIAAVALLVALPLVYLVRSGLEKDWEVLPRSKKTVEITEITDVPFAMEMVQGQWVLYLYYPSATRIMELSVDVQGRATSRSGEIQDELVVVLDENGELEMQGTSLKLRGTMHESGEHLDGMAVVKDSSSPIPFSCFKIGSPPGSG